MHFVLSSGFFTYTVQSTRQSSWTVVSGRDGPDRIGLVYLRPLSVRNVHECALGMEPVLVSGQ